MPSIKRFLLMNLLISIVITASMTTIGNYLLDNSDIQKHLDINLQQTTEFLDSMLYYNYYALNNPKHVQFLLNRLAKRTSLAKNNKGIYHFQFQVWNKKGKLLLHSQNATKSYLATKKNGFSNKQLENSTWRIYTLHNKKIGIVIAAAELTDFRKQLEKNITLDNIIVLLLAYPILGLLIWLTVGQSLESLKKIVKELACRSTADFTPIDMKNTAIELQPLIEGLNELFLRLEQEFGRNKRFASDAAHELRTPLAALRTQTQVALIASNETERKAVLKNVIRGVDRATHVVQQLLTLSRLGQNTITNDFGRVNLLKTTAEVLAQLAPKALKKHIEIELLENDKNIIINGNEIALCILIRNLVDNAIQYTPENGNLKVSIQDTLKGPTLKVIDNGPGIPPELRMRVFERFYRVLGTKVSGSGLGLAIVQQIVELHDADIKLGIPSSGKGLEVTIIFPVLK